MPRGRPRKPRLSRMDAAVDAMAPFGFSEKKVKKVVKELLKEYGGSEGWPFLEDCAYKELIDAILRDVEENDQERRAEDCDQSEDKSYEDEGASSSRVSAGTQLEDETLEDNVPPHTVVTAQSGIHNESGENIIRFEGNGKSWKDILPNELQSQKKNAIPASLPLTGSIPSSPPAKSLPTQTGLKFPCYGWIESEDEEPCDFMCLKSESPLVERKRKSRWDQKPVSDDS